MRVVLGIAVVLVVAIVGSLAWLYSGSYDVSARANASPVLDWLSDIAKRQSVRAHAQHMDAPPLADPLLVEDGAHHYRDFCAQCHGAPGVEALPFARAMRPVPPDFTKAETIWTPAQLFWITQNGLRMSGMPAFQASHVDGELWAIVAFLDQLPKMDAARYQAMMAAPAPPPAIEPNPADRDVVPPAEVEEPAQPSAPPPSEATPAPAPAPEPVPAPVQPETR